MASVFIASVNIPNWELGPDVVLRIYAQQSFEAADGSIIAAGVPSEDASENDNLFQSVACTLSGTTLNIAACSLESTTDSLDNPSARYGAFFFTNEGQRIGTFAEFGSFVLPSAPASTTWAAIAVAQTTLSSIVPPISFFAYTPTTEFSHAFANCSSNPITTQLPAASTMVGKTLSITKIDPTYNAVIVVPVGSDTIMGNNSFSFRQQWATYSFLSMESGWVVL